VVRGGSRPDGLDFDLIVSVRQPFPAAEVEESSVDTKSSASKQETAILKRIVRPQLGNLTPEAANAILDLKLGDQDQERLNALAVKAQDGTLSAEEEAELQVYRVLGRVISMMWSKARVALRKSGVGLASISDE
jgi:hypothetical protein